MRLDITKSSHYCLQCNQDRALKHFELVLAGESKTIKCDRCLDKSNHQERSRLQEVERKAKKEWEKSRTTSNCQELSATPAARDKVKTRLSIEEILELRRINKEYEL